MKLQTINTSDIISLLLNGYNLDRIIDDRKDISKVSKVSKVSKSGRITKKSVPIPDIKIITKNIYDIEEIQNKPDYNNDFFKMYSLKYIFAFDYLINKNLTVNEYVMKRFFSSSLLFNDKIYKLLSKIINVSINSLKLDEI